MSVLSGMWSLRNYLCSNRLSITHTHAGSIKWIWRIKKNHLTLGGESSREVGQKLEVRGDVQI